MSDPNSPLEQARDSVAMLEISMTSARADLAMAICNEIKKTTQEMGEKLAPLEALVKELPVRPSLDDSERKRTAAKLIDEIRNNLLELQGAVVKSQSGWQKDAR